jgi:hypothetical protein
MAPRGMPALRIAAAQRSVDTNRMGAEPVPDDRRIAGEYVPGATLIVVPGPASASARSS